MNPIDMVATDLTEYAAKVEAFYDHLRVANGLTDAALDTHNSRSQFWRHLVATYSVMLSQTVSEVLDVGCGHGDLLPILRKKGYAGDYLGIDTNDGAISVANNRYGNDARASFSYGYCGLLDPEKPFGAVVGIGLFALAANADVENRVDSVWWQYVNKEIDAMLALSSDVVVFNMLSVNAQTKTPGRAYVDPADVYWLISNSAMSFVTIDHSYLPHEFMVTLRKRPMYTPGEL